MGKYDVDCFQCDECGFVQAERPFWLEDAYKRPINILDAGYIARNIFYIKRLSMLFSFLFGKEVENGSTRFFDYAGGYDVFVRMMRDVGFDYYWDGKYTQNLFASGFEADLNKKFTAVTIFELYQRLNKKIKSKTWDDHMFCKSMLGAE